GMQLRLWDAGQHDEAIQTFAVFRDMPAFDRPGPPRVVHAHVTQSPACDLCGVEQGRDHIGSDLVRTADETLLGIVRRNSQKALVVVGPK
ncbi:hypothetical protein L2D77_32760, partial [Pseudomonas aeruginosa]|uniref:hypothetical protein n=1 Tax=Pseudomonas aeruginosa TaxID=287 RepID=UPI001F222B51